jgi:hypothetical protein
MKRNIFLILATIYFLTISCLNSQIVNNINSIDDNEIRINMLKSNVMDEQNLLINFISELQNYGKAFKYYEDINKGTYRINKTKDGYRIEFGENSKNRENEKKGNKNYIVINIKKVNKIVNEAIFDMIELKIEDAKDFFNEIEFEQNKEKNVIPITLNYRSRTFIDQKILNGVFSDIQTKILNQTVTNQKLRTYDNKPADVFGSIADAVIIPEDQGQNFKVFAIDDSWCQIKYFSSNFSPLLNERIQTAFSKGTNINNLMYPRSLVYGYTESNGDKRLYISDCKNNCLKFAKVNFHDWGALWYYTIFKNNVSYVFDMAYSKGMSLSNSDDDLLWLAYFDPDQIECINATTGDLVYSFNKYSYSGSSYSFATEKIDVYSEYVNNTPSKSMLAFVDKLNNAFVFIKLNNNGILPSRIPPDAFKIIKFPDHERITSAKFISNIKNSIYPVGVVISSIDLNGNGHLSTAKVVFSPSSQYTEPVDVQYITSSSTAMYGNEFSPIFSFLKDIEIQEGYSDIITIENWSENNGIRRLKPGVDVANYSWSPKYCISTGINLSVNVTNPVKVIAQTQYKKDIWPSYQNVTSTINGLVPSNGNFYLVPGTNNLNIKLNIPNTNDLPSSLVNIKLYLIPADETNYNSINGTSLSFVGGVYDCNSSGGCPYLYVQDSIAIHQDNNIFHKSEFEENQGQDIQDIMKLNVYPYFNNFDSTCTLQIKELNEDITYLDKVELKAIDHPSGTNIAITEDNDIALFVPHMIMNPSEAYLNSELVTCELQYDSICNPIEGEFGDTIITNSDSKKAMNIFKKLNYILSETINNIKIIEINENNKGTVHHDSLAVVLDSYSGTSQNQTKDYCGILRAFDNSINYNSGLKKFSRRENNSLICVPVGKDQNIDSVYSVWNRDFVTSFFCIVPIYYSGYLETPLDLVSAYDINSYSIEQEINEKDGNYAILENYNNFTLKYKNSNSALPQNWIRDYVIICDGKYIKGKGLKTNLLNKKELNNNLGINKYELLQNFPNPFNPITNIQYQIVNQGMVTLKVYDILGREVKVLVNEIKNPGKFIVSFDASSLSSGIYFYKLTAGEFTNVKRMVLVK